MKLVTYCHEIKLWLGMRELRQSVGVD